MLVLRLGDRRFSLRQPESFVGRSRHCDIRIRSTSVSRLHALFFWKAGALHLQDAGSTSGTSINGFRVEAARAVSAGDTVCFGEVCGRITYEHLGEGADPVGKAIPLTFPSLRPAPLLRRMAAAAVDTVLFAIGSALPLAPILVAAQLERHGIVPTWLPLDLQTRSMLAGVSLALWIIYLLAYVIVSWGRVGATPGMRLFGLRLVDWRGKLPIGSGRAWLRFGASFVTLLSLGAGLLVALGRRDRRALHDLLAGTWVAWNPFTEFGDRRQTP